MLCARFDSTWAELRRQLAPSRSDRRWAALVVMRAGVLADHVTAVPDIVADGEGSGFRLTQSAGVVGVIWD